MPCRHYRGPGSSPLLWEDLLILTFDGADYQYVTALNKATGETVWRTDRTTKWHDFDDSGVVISEGDLRKGFSTPIVVEAAGKKLLLSPGSSALFAYEPRTGKEIWHIPTKGHTPAPRPVFGDGVAFLFNGRGPTLLRAVKVAGEGDITAANIVWQQEAPYLPQEPSPLMIEGLLYLISNNGVITCLDSATGEVVWTERVGGNFVTSPIYADGRLYFCSIQGKTQVIKAGRTYEHLATNELDEGFMASPAMTGSALMLRTKTHLYRIEE
jgi:outer membrane protein assembly factor BamB